MNALEKTAWEEISSPVLRVHGTMGAHEPKTSQIGINAVASCGTWTDNHKNEKKKQNGKSMADVEVWGFLHAEKLTLSLWFPF